MTERGYFYRIKDLPLIPLNDKVEARFVLGERMLLSFIEQPPGAVFPPHRHESEQILLILEGSAEFTVDGRSFHLEAGDVCVNPPNAEHGGHTSTGFKGLDIFVPPREDYVKLINEHPHRDKTV